MPKVYVVLSGLYEDEHIDAVFSTKKLAKAFCEKTKSFLEDPSIEEYDVDTDPKSWVLTYVRTTQDGGFTSCRKTTGTVAGFYCFSYIGQLVWIVATEDEAVAKKTVNAKREQILAMNLWGNADGVRALFSHE